MLGKRKKVPTKVLRQRGKGGHITLYYGQKFTIVSMATKDLGADILNAMLNQLGIKKGDLEYRK